MVARARVDVILGGCALRETYEGTSGLVGESFTIYDAPRKVWHLVGFLIVVVFYDWPRLGSTERVAFSALDVLAVYMAWRPHQARQVFKRRTGDWRPRFTDHIDLGAPGWLVGVPAILGVVGGNLAVDAVKGSPRTASSS